MMKMPTARRELRTTPTSPLPACSWAALAILLVWALLSPQHLAAQAAPAVLGGDHTLWAGVEYSNFTPDFGPPQRLIGVGGYVDLNWNSRYAIEGEARFLRFNGFNAEYEDSYLAGPKINVFRHGKFRPYAKVLFGVGKINFPYEIGNGSYFAIAPGGGLDYRLTRLLILRAEYEYQYWPAAPGIVGEPSNGLHPNGFSAGVAYRFH